MDGEGIGDLFGINLADAGDTNSDGYHDLVVAATGKDTTSGVDAGRIYLYHGAAAPSTSAAGPSSNPYTRRMSS